MTRPIGEGPKKIHPSLEESSEAVHLLSQGPRLTLWAKFVRFITFSWARAKFSEWSAKKKIASSLAEEMANALAESKGKGRDPDYEKNKEKYELFLKSFSLEELNALQNLSKKESRLAKLMVQPHYDLKQGWIQKILTSNTLEIFQTLDLLKLGEGAYFEQVFECLDDPDYFTQKKQEAENLTRTQTRYGGKIISSSTLPSAPQAISTAEQMIEFMKQGKIYPERHSLFPTEPEIYRHMDTIRPEEISKVQEAIRGKKKGAPAVWCFYTKAGAAKQYPFTVRSKDFSSKGKIGLHIAFEVKTPAFTYEKTILGVAGETRDQLIERIGVDGTLETEMLKFTSELQKRTLQ